MPGGVVIRTLRLEVGATNDQQVKEQRARDKVLSMFEEEREAEVNFQRKGLSLASLFAKPPPAWAIPAVVGSFGDAFIQNTSLEVKSFLVCFLFFPFVDNSPSDFARTIQSWPSAIQLFTWL